jgi:hypothetical protein
MHKRENVFPHSFVFLNLESDNQNRKKKHDNLISAFKVQNMEKPMLLKDNNFFCPESSRNVSQWRFESLKIFSLSKSGSSAPPATATPRRRAFLSQARRSTRTVTVCAVVSSDHRL